MQYALRTQASKMEPGGGAVCPTSVVTHWSFLIEWKPLQTNKAQRKKTIQIPAT